MLHAVLHSFTPSLLCYVPRWTHVEFYITSHCCPQCDVRSVICDPRSLWSTLALEYLPMRALRSNIKALMKHRKPQTQWTTHWKTHWMTHWMTHWLAHEMAHWLRTWYRFIESIEIMWSVFFSRIRIKVILFHDVGEIWINQYVTDLRPAELEALVIPAQKKTPLG